VLSEALSDGTVLADRYRIISCIGQGGFGISYEAFDERLARRVAIKEHFPEGATRSGASISWSSRAAGGSKGGVDRFLSEARLLAKIGQRGHPGIVMGHDVFEENHTAYLVMEFLDGQTLEGSVLQHGPVDPETLQSFAVALCESLSVIHQLTDENGNAFLHQDVSPANVLVVAREGVGRYRPVLIDFGASRAFAASQSNNATQIVKVGYSAVEGYSAQAERGPGTDLYGLGATLYFCATGVQPIDAMARFSGVPLPRVHELATRITAEFAAAIEWAMQPTLSARPRSAAELAQAFRGSVKSTPPVPPPAASQNSNRTVRIDQVIPAPSAAPLVTARTLPRTKKNLPLFIAGAVGVLAIAGAIVLLLGKSDPKKTVTQDSLGAVAETTTVASATAGDPAKGSAGASEVPGESTGTTFPSSVPIQPISAKGYVGRSAVLRKCSGQRKSFASSYLIDGDNDTGWGASSGDGSGASITVGFGRPTRLTSVGLTPGFLNIAARSDLGCGEPVNAFTYNRFVEQVEYRFDDGSVVVQAFEQRPEMQRMQITPITTTNVKITIMSTRRIPPADNDTIISEAAFEGTQ
jgi:serine/threonine protein kinase